MVPQIAVTLSGTGNETGHWSIDMLGSWNTGFITVGRVQRWHSVVSVTGWHARDSLGGSLQNKQMALKKPEISMPMPNKLPDAKIALPFQKPSWCHWHWHTSFHWMELKPHLLLCYQWYWKTRQHVRIMFWYSRLTRNALPVDFWSGCSIAQVLQHFPATTSRQRRLWSIAILKVHLAAASGRWRWNTQAYLPGFMITKVANFKYLQLWNESQW